MLENLTYEGNDPYIFVSYAHRDTKTVLPILRALHRSGYRLWYDAGIKVGTEWAKNIEEHIDGAEVFVSLMSRAAADSSNCCDEIAYARKIDKEILLIYLEDEKDVVLPKGINMQTCRYQMMFRMRYEEEEDFLTELCNADILTSCWRDPASDGTFREAAENTETEEADAQEIFRRRKFSESFGTDPEEEGKEIFLEKSDEIDDSSDTLTYSKLFLLFSCVFSAVVIFSLSYCVEPYVSIVFSADGDWFDLIASVIYKIYKVIGKSGYIIIQSVVTLGADILLSFLAVEFPHLPCYTLGIVAAVLVFLLVPWIIALLPIVLIVLGAALIIVSIKFVFKMFLR